VAQIQNPNAGKKKSQNPHPLQKAQRMRHPNRLGAQPVRHPPARKIDPKCNLSATCRQLNAGEKVKTCPLENRKGAAPKFVLAHQGCATRL